eukprot:GILK01006482.1.p1 GENE.GILK01006482.1~~GILK01006482.1.p1  ORF type:complete len:523 (+),score=94.01 GILK01006482.1:41-1570(+)
MSTRKQKTKSKKPKALLSEAEEKRLEDLVFGTDELDVDSWNQVDQEEEHAEGEPSEQTLFVIDDGPRLSKKRKADGELQPAWQDEDDENVSVNIAGVDRLRKLRKDQQESIISGTEYEGRLRKQHEKLSGTANASWATLPTATDSNDVGAESDEDSEPNDVYSSVPSITDLLRSSQRYTKKTARKLSPGLIEVTRMADANQAEPNKSVVQRVQFHSNGQLLMSAGLDKTLRLFQVDGKRNAKVQSVFLPDMPILSASFTADGSEIIASGRRKAFYVYDLVRGSVSKVTGLAGREEKSLESMTLSPDGKYITFLGKDGYILLVSNKTKQLVGQLKMNGTARTAAFSPDGNILYSSGGDGEIYHWDLRTRTCIHRHTDEGCLKATALTVSPDGRYLASGSDSGVVNVYNVLENGRNLSAKPLKAVMNLTTAVGHVQFNSDSQILGMSSKWTRDSFKLLHLPSCTVFSNWPSSKTPLHFVTSFDFSPNSGFMAIGNDRGKVLLYRLNHYGSV